MQVLHQLKDDVAQLSHAVGKKVTHLKEKVTGDDSASVAKDADDDADDEDDETKSNYHLSDVTIDPFAIVNILTDKANTSKTPLTENRSDSPSNVNGDMSSDPDQNLSEESSTKVTTAYQRQSPKSNDHTINITDQPSFPEENKSNTGVNSVLEFKPLISDEDEDSLSEVNVTSL